MVHSAIDRERISGKESKATRIEKDRGQRMKERVRETETWESNRDNRLGGKESEREGLPRLQERERYTSVASLIQSSPTCPVFVHA